MAFSLLRAAPRLGGTAPAIRHFSIAVPSLASTSSGSIPRPRDNLNSPADFVTAVSNQRRGDLSSVLSALGDEPSWDSMFRTNGAKLKKGGVPVKERRYFLWALEKYRQGSSPSEFAHDIKPKKKVRGWGARVQHGIRIRGRIRPGEK